MLQLRTVDPPGLEVGVDSPGLEVGVVSCSFLDDFFRVPSFSSSCRRRRRLPASALTASNRMLRSFWVFMGVLLYRNAEVGCENGRGDAVFVSVRRMSREAPMMMMIDSHTLASFAAVLNASGSEGPNASFCEAR